MSDVHTIIQARTGSTRRPGKVLAAFPEGPLLIDWVVDRAEQIGFPVALCIPDGDTALEKVCMQREWTYTVGPEDDVLGRYRAAVETLGCDNFIRVTGDCPFLDVEAAKLTADQHLHSAADLTYHLAEGRGVQVFRREALFAADRLAKTPHDREHIDEYILKNPFRFKTEYMKFSVDTPEDLETARRRASL